MGLIVGVCGVLAVLSWMAMVITYDHYYPSDPPVILLYLLPTPLFGSVVVGLVTGIVWVWS